MAFCVEDHLDALREPGVFAEVGPVELIQTHAAVVCLVGDAAYKLKKAVRLPFLDFSTPARRAAACADELRLNRRLCPTIYCGLVDVRSTPAGLRIGAATPAGGNVVDCAVQMRRLPAGLMLDRLLAEDAVPAPAIDGLARRIARFHADAALSADDEVRRLGRPEAAVERIRANFTEAAALGVLPPRVLDAVRSRVLEALPAFAAALAGRVDRVVEGHGDLHARNVCLTEPAVVYDCLEFRRDFRCGDVGEDVAFLAMDLWYRGHRALATRFVDAYVAASGDHALQAVLPEFVRYRAMVRAKVDAFVAADPGIPAPDRERAVRGACRHLRLCGWSRIDDDGPWLVVLCGLPATGKSHVAAAIVRESEWPSVATDRVRKELAGVGPTSRLDATCYTAEFSERTYAAVLARAGAYGGSVVVDGNFPSVARRAAARACAERAGKRLVVVHVVTDTIEVERRLRDRAHDASAISDADQVVAASLRARFVAPETCEGFSLVTIDGAADASVALDEVVVGMLVSGRSSVR